MSDVLHMKVGPRIGEILLEISQTNIASGDPEKGIRTYTDGLQGFTEEYAIKLLKNQAVLVASENGTEVILTDEDIERSLNSQNIFDWELIVDDSQKDLLSSIEYHNECKRQFDYGDIEDYSLYEMIGEYEDTGIHNLAAKLIAGDDFAWDLPSNEYRVWENLCINVESDKALKYEKSLWWTVEYVKNIKRFHIEYIKFSRIYKFLVGYKFIEPIPKVEDLIERILRALVGFTDTGKGYHHPMCDEKLYSYKEKLYNDILGTTWGKEFCQNKILKKNLLDGYDAGWLSPEGEFYGGSGPTSSNIHTRIAEDIFEGNSVYSVRMVKDGVTVWGAASNSPEYWLESHGWIKIHHDEIYGNFIGNKTPEPDFPYPYCPTEVQVRMICEYSDKFFGGKFRVEPRVIIGLKEHPEVTTYQVRQMDEIQLHMTFGK